MTTSSASGAIPKDPARLMVQPDMADYARARAESDYGNMITLDGSVGYLEHRLAAA